MGLSAIKTSLLPPPALKGEFLENDCSSSSSTSLLDRNSDGSTVIPPATNYTETRRSFGQERDGYKTRRTILSEQNHRHLWPVLNSRATFASWHLRKAAGGRGGIGPKSRRNCRIAEGWKKGGTNELCCGGGREGAAGGALVFPHAGIHVAVVVVRPSVRPSDFSSSSRYFAHEDETGNFVKMDCKRDCGCEIYEIFCFSDLDSVSCSISSPRVQALIAASTRLQRPPPPRP